MSLNDSKLKSSRAKERPPLATPELSATPQAESDTPKPATSGCHQSSDQLPAPDAELSVSVTASSPTPATTDVRY